MPSPKRKYSGIERELIRTLTLACETAKSEIVGFQWLTHDVDYEQFPQSLVVTWVFDSEANKARALACADKARMRALTLAAFDEVGISVSSIADHVAFSVERPARASVAKDIENPCVSLCQLNSELCVSCGRTREEIRKWRGMKRPEKMATVQKAAARMKSIAKKKGKSQ